MSVRTDALRSGAREQRTIPPGAYQASVARNTAPGEPLTLTLPNLADQGTLEFPAEHWNPKPAGTPVVGDECLLIIDETGTGWVTMWARQGD
jgi:hypothetical protein